MNKKDLVFCGLEATQEDIVNSVDAALNELGHIFPPSASPSGKNGSWEGRPWVPLDEARAAVKAASHQSVAPRGGQELRVAKRIIEIYKEHYDIALNRMERDHVSCPPTHPDCVVAEYRRQLNFALEPKSILADIAEEDNNAN